MSNKSVLVPWQKISVNALRALIDEFILREGTDYGEREFWLHEKHEAIMERLVSGEAIVVFDTELQSTSIILKQMFV